MKESNFPISTGEAEVERQGELSGVCGASMPKLEMTILPPYCMSTKGYVGSKMALVGAVLLILAVAVVMGGCGSGSGSTPLDGTYIYASPQGDLVLSLNLVQRGSRLSGEAEELAPVTSEEANGLSSTEGVIFDAHGHSVPLGAHNITTNLATESTDNGACGGTPLCFYLKSASVDGRIGNENRVSLHFSWSDASGFPAGQEAWVGAHPGSTLDLYDHGTKLSFRPSDRHKVEAAEREAPGKLRVVGIPLYGLYQVSQELQKNGLDKSISGDVTGMQQSLKEAQQQHRHSLEINFTCFFPEIFKGELADLQKDVQAEEKEISKARTEIDSLPRTAARFSSEPVATLEKTISEKESVINTKLKVAKTTTREAQKELENDESIWHKLGCGVGLSREFIQHLLLELPNAVRG
jgi:hypothetical protein